MKKLHCRGLWPFHFIPRFAANEYGWSLMIGYWFIFYSEEIKDETLP